MTTVDATSEVFMTAFRALPKKARERWSIRCSAIRNFGKT